MFHLLEIKKKNNRSNISIKSRCVRTRDEWRRRLTTPIVDTIRLTGTINYIFSTLLFININDFSIKQFYNLKNR